MAVTPVDILTLGDRRRQQMGGGANTTPSPAEIEEVNRKEQQIQTLNRQVEVGLGSRVDNVMSDRDKQLYIDGLSDTDRTLMQKYKSEGYGFMASKALVENKKKLADPYQNGTNKYKDYDYKEQYYNKTGVEIDPDSALGRTALFLQKIGFDDQYGNPINKVTQNYNERYANERQAMDTLIEAGEVGTLGKIGRWLERTLLSAESGIINAINNIASAGQGVGDIAQSSMTATLDNAILGLDTDQDFYRKEDRRLDEYLIEGGKGTANLVFRAVAPKVMLGMTAIGETKTGGEILEMGDKGVRRVVEQGLKIPGINQYYDSLDEQGREDMLDLLTTGAYWLLMKGAGKGIEKFKANTKPGQRISQQETYLKNTRNLFKESLDKGIKGAKEQIGKEVQNRKTATDMYDGTTGKITGRYGEQGQTGIKNETSRVVQAGVDAFKKNFQEGVARSNQYNAYKRGGVMTEYDGTQAYQPTAEPTDTVVGKPNNQKGVVGKAKDIVKGSRDDMMTGLTPEERIRIKNDPFVKEKFEKATGMIKEAGMPLEEAFITEQLYNEIGDKIKAVFDEWENKLGETSPYYKEIRNLNTTYTLTEALPEITSLLAKNDIAVDPLTGELDFTNSKFVSDADMRSVQRAVDMINRTLEQPINPREYLNLRSKLDQLAKYTTVDASRGQGLIRQIRHTMDGVAKKEIPGLKEIDNTTSKYFKEISELKDGWVYKGGDRKGEIRNNFYSIIKNLTGHNRKVMLQRLEKYYPGIAEEIEAVHLTAKLVKAYNKSPQIIKAMGVGGGIAGASGGNIIKAFLGAIIGEMAQEGIIRPITKSFRMKAIDKLLSEISPEAQAKLQEIALKQTYAKEMSAEDKRVLEKVADIIAQERERGLSEEAIREREQRTKSAGNELGYHPDVIDENGNMTLGIGNPISPEQGPGRARRLTRVNEINLKNPEITPDKQALDLQEKLDIDTETAMDIQNRMNDFIKEIGADETGTIGGREVNYDKFRTASLEELMDNDSLPRTEKEKIGEALMKRGIEAEAKEQADMDKEYAYRINKLTEEEKRIGKIGRNKVGKEVAERQARDREKKKERLIEKIGEDYGIDQFQASDKYAELEDKPIDYINSYKRTDGYKTEQAEREILNSLMEERNKQPKFIRDMDEVGLRKRQDFINNMELKNGYKLETTDYNDRYVLEENGQIIDRGAIKYNENGDIEVTAQNVDGIRESGLLDSLPNDATIRVSGEEGRLTAGDMKDYDFQDEITANPNEEIISYEDALLIKDFKNGRTAKELADEYGLSIDKIDSIITGRGMKAFGRYKDGKIEILENPKVSTLHHEIFHGAMDIVDAGRKTDIIETVMKRKGMNEGDANEWLAEKFSEYARTGELDKGELPKTVRQKIKSFFKKVKERFDGVWKDRKKIQKLFDDILEVKIERDVERDMINTIIQYQKGGIGSQKGVVDTSSIRSLIIDDSNSSRFKSKLDDIVRGVDSGDVTKDTILEEFKKLIKTSGKESEYATIINGNGIFTLRVSDHHANAWYSKVEGHPDNNTSIVLKSYSVPKKGPNGRKDKFIKNKYVDLEEFVYNIDIITPEGMKGIIEGLKDLIDEGVYTDTAFNDYKKSEKKVDQYQYQIEQKSLFDIKPELTPFEQYFKKHGDLIDIMGKTYDPDIVERQGNLIKKGFSGLKMQDLYEIRNLLEDYIKEKGQTPVSNEIGDNTTLDVLVEKANRIKKNQKVGSYDKKQIEKIGKETEQIIENRIADVDIRYDRGDIKDTDLRDIRADEFADFKEEYVYQLGKTYNPDVEKWHNNLKKALKEITKEYEGFKGMTRFGNVVQTNGLNSLKSKVRELEKYSYEDIYNTIDGSYTDRFMAGIEEAKKTLDAEEIDKAVTNLVALSNMSVENFKKQMENFGGKSPMPSIAVMDVNVPHEVFGDLTLVFGRDTVDPKVDPANKMYASDAWTPTFPELKDKGSLGDYDRVKQMSSDIVDMLYNRGLDLDPSDLGYFAEELKSQLLDIDGRDDLGENADRLAEQVFRDTIENLENDNYGIKDLGEKVADTGMENAVVDMLENFIRESAESEQVIPASYFFKENWRGDMDEVAERLLEYGATDKDYFEKDMNGEKVKGMIKDILFEEMGNGVDKIIEEIQGFKNFNADDPRIRTLLTEVTSGQPTDRPATLENILEAMKSQRLQRPTKPGDFRDMIEIEGTQLNDIEDVRRQNFAKVFHGDRTGDLGDLEKTYAGLIDIVKEQIDIPIIGTEIIKRAIKDAYNTDVDTFKRNLIENELKGTDYSETFSVYKDIPNEVLQRIIDVVEQGKKIPIRFSESKPERIVDLNREVEYILAPKGDADKVQEIVKGTPLEGKVVEYTPDDYSAPRSQKLKELQKKYGNVFFSMGGVIMPIAMLYLMMEQEEEGQA